jgi:hypothetical protein
MSDEPRTVDEPQKLLAELAEAGNDWRSSVWTTLDTLGVFDDTYMADGWEAFCHNNIVYWRDSDSRLWNFEMEVIDFLKENPPNEECKAVLELHEYAAGIGPSSDPWLLFQYVVGIAATTQSMGLASLMGITEQECLYLGDAIYGYGSKASIVHPYVELLLSFAESVIP